MCQSHKSMQLMKKCARQAARCRWHHIQRHAPSAPPKTCVHENKYASTRRTYQIVAHLLRHLSNHTTHQAAGTRGPFVQLFYLHTSSQLQRVDSAFDLGASF